ncbi:HdeD family acid-resistance protein [Sulfurivirga sp.]|uniref:HdeD family acid-resistance protein n=1 Tax=Sulfurivirga sp. TaxID=2614236 RepID=UPI0025D3DF8A|nr:DUF308 domain-containing protein [Sulfurivirga sp.]
MSIYLNIQPSEEARRLGNRTFWLGVALIIVGTLGIVLPEVMALAINFMIAWLLILGGVLAGYFTWLSPDRDLGRWAKPVLLLVIGVLLALLPQVAIATLTLLLAVYFIMDSFMNVVLARQIYPLEGWGLTALNALVTFMLALLALWQFPQNTPVFLGVIVGVSLLFDGIVMARVGWALKKRSEVVIDE